jgi:hypothetical protein
MITLVEKPVEILAEKIAQNLLTKRIIDREVASGNKIMQTPCVINNIYICKGS